LKLGDKVYSFSKGYKTLSHDVRNKLRGLDAVAGKKGMDKQLARDTFTYKEWDEAPKLQVIDAGLTNAPVWAKKLSEGERRPK